MLKQVIKVLHLRVISDALPTHLELQLLSVEKYYKYRQWVVSKLR